MSLVKVIRDTAILRKVVGKNVHATIPKGNNFSTADCCLFTRTLTRGPDGKSSFNVEEIFGLGLSLFRINVQINEIPVTCVCFY